MAFFIIGENMKKYEIVKTHQDFNEIIQNGKVLRSPFFNIYQKKNGSNSNHFGIAVGKKLGNAVFRNYQKRKIRMILTNHKKEFSKGHDYIIIMKEKSKTITYQEFEKQLLELLLKGETNEK